MLKGTTYRAVALWGAACLLTGLASATSTWAQTTADVTLETVVVTGNPEGEERHKSPATVWVIDEEKIKRSNSSSITNLLAESAVGYFS